MRSSIPRFPTFPTTTAVRALLAAAALVTLPAAPAAGAGAPADTVSEQLLEALRAHRHPLSLEEGELAGPGAELLVREAARARYTLVGETHGVAEVPGMVAALFRRLVPAGYRHLAVEIGPVQADRIGELLAGPEPLDAYRGFLAEHWPGVPFYAWRPEAELLVEAVRAGGGAGVLWGLDYDIMGDRYPLARLRELAPDPAARAAADSVAGRADSLLAHASRTGDLSSVLMFSGPPSIWTRLRAAYAPEPGSEADRILGQLEATARINEAWTSGRRWRSNRLRVDLLKRNFLRHRRRADPGARVLVKLGGAHVVRGRTLNNTFDLGNLLSELARSESDAVGEGSGGARDRSFHLLVLGGADAERAAIAPKGLGVRRVPTFLTDPPAGLAPFAAAAHPDRWTLFDLRPLRPLVDAGELGELPPDLERRIFGFDAVLVLVGSTAADALVEPR